MVTYIPDRGDIVWLEFEPQKGKAIQKTRPTLIISPKAYNQKTQLALCMPITSKIKNYPFEVVIHDKDIKGAILSDQMRSFDWHARKMRPLLLCVSLRYLPKLF
jgi:mRNA interferase MazF